MTRTVNACKASYGRRAYAVFALCAATAMALPGQTFTTLYTFHRTDGAQPIGVIQATNGELYGTTFTGGAKNGGTVFAITPGGTLTTLHSFSGSTDGREPEAVLVQATNGEFYGTTDAGGAADEAGTVFSITPSGTLTTLHGFCAQPGCPDGSLPNSPLIQATDGEIYGTTPYGGVNCGDPGCGTVFKMTPSGTLTTLYTFCSGSGCRDGDYPGGLLQAIDGNFYGTTAGGGAHGNYGTIFKITPGGTLTTLYSFCAQSGCTDGFEPNGLLQATDGGLYGTTLMGGANGQGTIFAFTSSGTLTTLYSFCAQSGCADGDEPDGGLIQATDGNFYGATAMGGAKDYGTIFKITPGGALTTLYSFCSQSNCTDGEDPEGLIQDTNGAFYGAAYIGGVLDECRVGCGTIFSLSIGLVPFVKTLPTSGSVGAAVKILGTNLTGATSVSFNGTAAVFTVVSGSEITTTVPTGATTGTVMVVTPGGTLSSNVSFRVS